jgi:hypothetical protein
MNNACRTGCGKPNSAQKNRRHEKLAMLAMLAMLLVFPVFSAVFHSKVTLPTLAKLAMSLDENRQIMRDQPRCNGRGQRRWTEIVARGF